MGDGCQHRCGDVGFAGDQFDQHRQPWHDAGVGARAPKPLIGDKVGGGKRVQPSQRLTRCLLPYPDERRRAAFERLRHSKCSREYRIGLTAVGYLHRASVEDGGRPCCAQRGLRRRGGPAPQVGAVAVRLAERLAGLVACCRDAGQLDQRCQGVRRHSGKASGARVGTPLGCVNQATSMHPSGD